MRAVTSAPGVAVVLILLVMTAVSGCTSGFLSGSAAPPAPTASQATTPASAASAAAAPSASAGGVQNLVVSNAIRSELLSAWAAGNGDPIADVTTVPGSVYYAYDPATSTYWAQASFEATGKVPLNVQVSFQDGGNIGRFKRVAGGAWQVGTGGIPEVCYALAYFPQPVLATWAMPTSDPAACPRATDSAGA
jgi:hypothetical protein